MNQTGYWENVVLSLGFWVCCHNQDFRLVLSLGKIHLFVFIMPALLYIPKIECHLTVPKSVANSHVLDIFEWYLNFLFDVRRRRSSKLVPWSPNDMRVAMMRRSGIISYFLVCYSVLVIHITQWMCTDWLTYLTLPWIPPS